MLFILVVSPILEPNIIFDEPTNKSFISSTNVIHSLYTYDHMPLCALIYVISLHKIPHAWALDPSQFQM